MTVEQLDELVDRVARRVVELLDERDQAQLLDEVRHAETKPLVDAATIARILGISRATVYEHSGALGAVRLLEGSRPRLRFDVTKARAAWEVIEGSRSADRRSIVSQPQSLRIGPKRALRAVGGDAA